MNTMAVSARAGFGRERGLRGFARRTVSHPSEPCWPSLSETQFFTPAASRACSKCCDSNAKLLSRISTHVVCEKIGIFRIALIWLVSSRCVWRTSRVWSASTPSTCARGRGGEATR